MGFSLDLLGSKRYNLNVISTLKQNQLEEVRRILLKHFFCRKFHENVKLQTAIQRGDKEAMAEGLKHRRLRPVYLIWKNPRFKDRPDIGPSLP